MANQETKPPSQSVPRAMRAAGPPPPPRTSGRFPVWAIVLIVLGALVLLLIIVLPIWAKAHEAANRAQCLLNARQIGLAMIQYAGDYDGSFPPTVDSAGAEIPGLDPSWNLNSRAKEARTAFAVLLKHGYVKTTKVFICPSSPDVMPPDTFPTDFTRADLRNLILGENNCSYGWDITKRHNADETCAILADKPRKTPGTEGSADNNSENHRGEGQCVFYNDGHVKWATTPRADLSSGIYGFDPDIYTGSTAPDSEYWKSGWDAKIIR